MKITQARLLVYLNNVSPWLRYKGEMAKKLNIDYSHVHKTLKEMVKLGWLKTHKTGQRIIFIVQMEAPVEQAKEMLAERFGVPPWRKE